MNQTDLEILIKELQALPKECEWLEFKVNNCNPEEIGEYISALSNSASYHHKDFAYLVFGLEDATHRAIGTKFRPRQSKHKSQELENWLVTQLDPRIDVSIHEFVYEGVELVLFQIPATPDRPVKFKGTPFIRIGSYKKRLGEHPEKERQIWSNNKGHTFEKEIAKSNLSLDEVLELIDFESLYGLLNIPVPEEPKAKIDRLIQEKIIRSVKKSYSITNLGAVLFARELDKFDSVSRKAIRMVIYDGNNRIKTKKSLTGNKGYAVGFQKLIGYLENELPSNEIIDKALRKKVALYPKIAVRELVANAIIHQDFSIKGSSTLIEVFDNRLEITNPGKPLIDTMRFIDHSPESRNEILASLMRRVNICEERGSGIDKVVFECEYHQLPAPEFIAGPNYTRAILYGHKTFNSMDKKDKIRACYLHACLKHVSGEIMTNQSLRERFGIKEHNYSIASRIIADTKNQRLIKDYDPDNKSKTYAKYLPFWA